jgi:hypothetical protein
MDAYEQKYQDRVVKTLKQKAQALGFDLVLTPLLRRVFLRSYGFLRGRRSRHEEGFDGSR